MRSLPTAAIFRSAFLCLMLLPASTPAQGMQADRQATSPIEATAKQQSEKPTDWATSVDILPDRLDGRDRATALRALHVALDQLSDGAALIWRKRSLKLEGVIRPISAFRDTKGRICRHLTYQFKIADYNKRIEGVACRQTDGSWTLSS